MEDRKKGKDRSEQLLRWVAMALALACFVAAGACGGEDVATGDEDFADWVVAAQDEPPQNDAVREVSGGDTAGVRPGPPLVETPAAPRVVTYAEAEAAFHAARYGEAIDLFSAYLDENPANPWVHYMLGLSAWKGGHIDIAETHLLESVELAPDHLKGRVNLARVLIEAGRPGEAQEQAAAAEEMDPASAVAKRVLARALAEGGDWQAAVDKYEDALWIDPGDTWSLNNLGFLLVMRGRYDDAIGPLALAVQLDSANATFQNNLGSALEGAGFPAAALAAFRSAAAAEPDGKAAASLARLQERVRSDAVPEVTTNELAQAYREVLLLGASARRRRGGAALPGCRALTARAPGTRGRPAAHTHRRCHRDGRPAVLAPRSHPATLRVRRRGRR